MADRRQGAHPGQAQPPAAPPPGAEPEAVHWDGAVNAHRVLGEVYRMGRHEWLTERGWGQMYGDGVRTVVDLRNAGERTRRPTDPTVAEAARAGIAVVHRPVEDHGHEEYMAPALADGAPYPNHPRYYAGNLKHFPDKLAEVFRTIAAVEGGVVLHCSAGRDRTGLVVTMLLQLAGRRDLVVPQYDAGARGINAWHLVSPVKHPHERHLAEEELEEFLAGRLAALEAFADSLAVEEFLLSQGMTRGEIRAVLAKTGARSG